MPGSRIRLINDTRGVALADRGRRAESFWSRGKGLMFEAELPTGDCLVIEPCGSIHMFFMRFPLDVLYVDRTRRVVRAQEDVKPWRIGPLRTRHAHAVIELPTGSIRATGTLIGDQLRIEPA